MTTEQLKKRHPFSYTLGEGPFTYVGFFDLGQALRHAENFGDTASAMRDAPRLEAGMGTCAHCGHAILNIFIVRRGDGKLYGVGSDCILKVHAEGEVGKITEMERQMRKAAKDKRRNKEEMLIKQLGSDYQAALAILATKPHPNDYYASKGKTAKDYYEYCSKSSKTMKAAIKKSKE